MLKFKEGQTYICTESYVTRFTKGKEYHVFKDSYNDLVIQDTCNTIWYDDEVDVVATFKLKDGQHKITLDDLAQDALETTFTLTQVRDSIVKAYQLFDNDSQRLAYLKGYFAK